MNILAFCTTLSVLVCCELSVIAGGLRASKNNEIDVIPEEQMRRNLKWVFAPTQKVIDNNKSYDWYGDDEVPDNKSMNDAPDFLRASDVCYKNGSYSRSNCPATPDCNWSGKFGPAKLCINRAPTPNKTFYVAVMKCIPQWENCDKCLCGVISSDKGAGARCIFNGDTPDDDSLSLSCSKRNKFSFQGYSWTVPP